MTRPPHPIRLVALDLDGTTLNPDHDLSPATVEAIAEATDRGVIVVLASGRLSHSILPFARRLGLGGVHIGLNGGVAFDAEGRFRHQHLLTPEQLALAHRLLEDEGLPVLVFGALGLWSNERSDAVEFLHSAGEPPARTYDPGRLDQIELPAKVVTLLGPGPLDAAWAARLEPRLHVVRSGPHFLEFMPPGVSKGNALGEYLADLGIDRRHVMAVGDSENDASLLAAAGFRVAMGNAVPALKAQADVVTGTNADDGVAQALRRFVLEK